MPQVNFCIVCEDIRTETYGKLSILGFFGLLPYVHIRVQALNTVMGRVLFLINITGDPGVHTFKIEILSPANEVVKSQDLAEMEIIDAPDKRSMAAVAMEGFPVNAEGDYQLRLSENDVQFYNEIFKITVGAPDLFAQ